MRAVKIGELKNNLSKYLRLVRKGETIRVLDRDEPVAELRPTAPTTEEIFDRLVREGKCKPATASLKDWKGLPPLKTKRPFTDQDVVDAIRALDGD